MPSRSRFAAILLTIAAIAALVLPFGVGLLKTALNVFRTSASAHPSA